MLLSKSGAVKAIKAAYRKGYQIMPGNPVLTIGARSWVARVYIQDLPKEVSMLLVEQAGYIPSACELIKHGQHNQAMLREEMARAEAELNGYILDAKPLRRLPVVYRDKWRLYLDEQGKGWAYDEDLLAILEPDIPVECGVMSWGAAVFSRGGEALVVLPAILSDEDEEAVQAITGIYRDKRELEQPETEPENMCLWEDED